MSMSAPAKIVAPKRVKVKEAYEQVSKVPREVLLKLREESARKIQQQNRLQELRQRGGSKQIHYHQEDKEKDKMERQNRSKRRKMLEQRRKELKPVRRSLRTKRQSNYREVSEQIVPKQMIRQQIREQIAPEREAVDIDPALKCESQGRYELGPPHHTLFCMQRSIDGFLSFKRDFRREPNVPLQVLFSYLNSVGYNGIAELSFRRLLAAEPTLYTFAAPGRIRTVVLSEEETEARTTHLKRRFTQVPLIQ